jgi:hypothetical protein
MRYFTLSLCFLFLACGPKPFLVKPLTIKSPQKIELKKQTAFGFESEKSQSLKLRYEALGRPSFALVNGNYRLPSLSPYGAVSLTESAFFGGYSRKLAVEKNEKDFAIKPIPATEAKELNLALNVLLNMKVKIKELAMTEALLIASAEEKAAATSSIFTLDRQKFPDIDYLMSFFEAQAEEGPILIGRVIGKDGRLFAFRTMPVARNSLAEMILALFEDSINRL